MALILGMMSNSHEANSMCLVKCVRSGTWYVQVQSEGGKITVYDEDFMSYTNGQGLFEDGDWLMYASPNEAGLRSEAERLVFPITAIMEADDLT